MGANDQVRPAHHCFEGEMMRHLGAIGFEQRDVFEKITTQVEAAEGKFESLDENIRVEGMKGLPFQLTDTLRLLAAPAFAHGGNFKAPSGPGGPGDPSAP